jgi:aspartyl-tRNA(Asn)/glutamyl-tRNA(Gln) amidotransferase subunit A
MSEPRSSRADDLAFASAADLGAAYASGEATPVDLVEAQLARIERFDPALRAFVTVRADGARADAERAARELRDAAPRSPLHGVTVAVKDVMLVDGLPMTGGSRVLDRAPAEGDATVVARLRAAGAIVLGTLNTHEFHAGPTRDFPFGTPRNPWDLERAPGGSSSGSASAVAAGFCTVSLGGDTGGSIRGPAAMCGVVGLKPTWGRVSRAGIIPLAPSLDVVGPLGRRVDDVAAALAAIAGRDDADPSSSARPVPEYVAPGASLAGVRVGVIEELMDPESIDGEVLAAVEAALERLRALGARVEGVRIPSVLHAMELMWALVMGEAIGTHRTWLRERYEAYDTNTRTRLLAGAALPAGVLDLARRARSRVAADVAAAFERFDVLASPTSGGPPPPVDQPHALIAAAPTYQAFNLSGHPALSVPCGFDAAGLPIGLQLAGRAFAEADLFRVARAYEAEARWFERRPARVV